MTDDRPAARRLPRRDRLAWSAAAGLILGMGVLLLAPACKKKGGTEAPGGGTGTGTAAAPEAPPTPTSPPPAPGPSFKASAAPGGSPFNGLKAPSDVAVDDQGRVWVIDQGDSALRLFDAAGGALGGWGGRGSGQFGMRDPCGIAVRGDNVYVADTYNTGIALYTMAGQFKAKSNAGLYNPHDVAVGSGGEVWISDSGNNRLILCDGDLSNPRAIGKTGTGPDEFASPNGIAVAPNGDVYVADAGNGRIQVLDSKGTFKSRLKYAWGANAEAYVDIDADGAIFVSDPNAGAVVRLDRSGKETKRWTVDDDGNKLLRPRGLNVDRKRRVLYVANTDSNTISKIKLEK